MDGTLDKDEPCATAKVVVPPLTLFIASLLKGSRTHEKRLNAVGTSASTISPMRCEDGAHRALQVARCGVPVTREGGQRAVRRLSQTAWCLGRERGKGRVSIQTGKCIPSASRTVGSKAGGVVV
jgi:hypothetical protein